MVQYIKYAIGTPLFVLGWYFFFISAHLLLNGEASMTRILLGGLFGLVAAMVGGYIMAPILAKQIAEMVTEQLSPLFGLLPGGRRRTDPPASPSD